MRIKKKQMFLSIICVIVLSIIGGIWLLNSKYILKNFNIISVKNEGKKILVNVDKVLAAVKYRVEITNDDGLKIYDNTFKDNFISFNLSELAYNSKYHFKVIAISKDNEERDSNNIYDFKYNDASLSRENGIILNNTDYYLNIVGSINDDYQIKVYVNDELKNTDKLDGTSYMIPVSLYQDMEAIVKVELLRNKIMIDELKLFNNLNPVSDVVINSPTEGAGINYGNVTLDYSGGENASEVLVNIYNGNNFLLKSVNIHKDKVILAKEIFTGGNYKVEVVCKYGDYEKRSAVNFSIDSKKRAGAVYISSDWHNLKPGTKVELKSSTGIAKIYYTLNGEDPESMGHLYTEPIEINNNTTLKTVAMADDMYNSIVKEYNIVVGKKTNLKVYLSPSNQVANLGVESTGYTNERDEMNNLSNYIEERLKQFGVKVIRNNPATGINDWNYESNVNNVDVHIAIHSNASEAHNVYGVETWIDNENSNMFSLANFVQNNLVNIYPYNDEVGNRGVKFANGALGEVNNNYSPVGLLVEIAHHDYETDAAWIMQNKKIIGYNIADSIMKFYGII